MSDDEEGNGLEGEGHLEGEDEFYPESSQWEAEEEEEEEEVEEEKVTQSPPEAAAAAITEKVTSVMSDEFLRNNQLFGVLLLLNLNACFISST